MVPTIKSAIENNATVMDDRDGRPGLDYHMQSYVLIRDYVNNRVLLGGLGGMGIGQMWFASSDIDKEYGDKMGFSEAEIKK